MAAPCNRARRTASRRRTNPAKSNRADAQPTCVRAFETPGEVFRSPGRPAAAELSEVEQLRRELARAQEELAILKKFDAYLTRLKK